MNALVVKIGGSLMAYPEKLKTLCTMLSEFSRNHSLIVVPGGGEFADVTRRLDEKFSPLSQCITSDGNFRNGSIWFFAFRFNSTISYCDHTVRN